MNWNPGWLLLLSVCARVCSVPIDRNVDNQEVKEEVQEENGVTVSVIIHVLSYIRFSLRVSLFWVICPLHRRTLASTTTGISERWSRFWRRTLTSERNCKQQTQRTSRWAPLFDLFILYTHTLRLHKIQTMMSGEVKKPQNYTMNLPSLFRKNKHENESKNREII